jgi:hypothetical protein
VPKPVLLLSRSVSSPLSGILVERSEKVDAVLLRPSTCSLPEEGLASSETLLQAVALDQYLIYDYICPLMSLISFQPC